MDTLLIEKQDIRQLVDRVGLDTLMREMIGAVESAFVDAHNGALNTPQRAGFAYRRPELGLIEWMPSMRQAGPIAIKVVGHHPSNPSALQLPTILSTVSLYDTRNGHLLGLADATFLTALRTGAASALASRWLAKPDARVLGIIGCGAQAVSQIHALCQEFPELAEVHYFDCDPQVMESLPQRLAPLRLTPSLRSMEADELTSTADILCTATSVDVGASQVFEASDYQPWLHVNAVGSDFPGKTEIPLDLLRKAFVSPDFPAQALVEGECQRLKPDEVGEDLATIAANPDAFASHRHELTVFDSTGWAVEDLAAMELLLDYANELKLGKRIALESVSTDPMNPHEVSEASPTTVPLPERSA